VCFPGGRLEKRESDLVCGIREVFEETGIDLNKPDSIYIGKTPINKYLYLKKGKKSFLSHLVYFSLSGLVDSLKPELKNPVEPE
jgi:8-oxo-dGTP pyrophosphatase MutT (NUDIX family)